MGGIGKMESYHIDLATLLRALARKSGELMAILKNIPGTREQGRVRVTLDKGKIISCSVEGQNGYLAFGENALRLLHSVGELDWTYTPSVSVSPVPQSPSLPVTPQEATTANLKTTLESPAITLGAYPARLRSVGQQELASWSRLQRSVYSLVDGKKTVADITRILSYQPERITEVLSTMHVARILVLLSQPYNDADASFKRKLPPNFE